MRLAWRGTAWRCATALLLVANLSACDTASDDDQFWRDATFWQDGRSSEAALAALGKGDLVRAEALGNRAMQRNPKDPYAILALAIVYQNTGRAELARGYYEALISVHIQEKAIIGLGPNVAPRSIDEIARENLAAIGGPRVLNRAATMTVAAPPPMDPPTDVAGAEDAAVITRFQTLRRLLDEGLITREEYDVRRGTNLGALLRYTAPVAPAATIGRPSPAPEQLVQRLKALSAHYEEKSISATEQAAERSIILEALLPAHPERRADRPPPVTNQMDYAAAAGRLQKLREANVITDAEQTREKGAMMQAVAAFNARQEAAAKLAAGQGPVADPTGPGVQLASFHSEAQAQKAWAALQKQFPKELGDLQASVKKAAVRRHGVVWRLSAGPLADQKAAVALCRNLRHYGQSCAYTLIK